MAPNGGPSMTSQARAAELNAAAAARARILNGYRDCELPDFIPRSTPSQFPTSHTNNTEHGAVESFRRPNRPVDRYYPPIATTPAPVPTYAYPQSQYTGPRAIPAVYAPTHYHVATEYYQPVYHPVQSYQQMYPSYMSGYPPPASPLHRGALLAMTHKFTSRSAAASPTKPGSSQSVQAPATSPVNSPRFPGPENNSWGSPPKSPAKSLRATPSPKKPPVEVLRFFTPDDLSPTKVEVDIKRFKAELENIPPAKDEGKPSDNAEGKDSSRKSPEESNSRHEGDNGHQKGKHKDDQPMPCVKKQELLNVARASSTKNHSAVKARLEARRQPSSLDDSPLTRKTFRKSMAEMARPFSFLPPGFIPRSGLNDILTAENQQQTLRVSETHSTKLDGSIHQGDELYVAQKPGEAIGKATPKTAPRRLQSPFQLRTRTPVSYYKAIVNKYPRNVFASRQSRLEEIWKVETGNSWLNSRQKPGVNYLSGPSIGFPRFPLMEELAQRPMNTGVLMPPPGFTVPVPILLPRSTHWSPESSPSNRTTTYYNRVLAGEDWFHQNILKKVSSKKFQERLNQAQSVMYNVKDPFNDLPSPAKDTKAVQMTELIKRLSIQLNSYTDMAENERRGFDFGDVQGLLHAGAGLKRLKINRRKHRRPRCGRKHGVDFDIAPGSELFDGNVVRSELADGVGS